MAEGFVSFVACVVLSTFLLIDGYQAKQMGETVATSACGAAKDRGFACAENSPSSMFYFDSHLAVCQPFRYKGCGGNENRFVSVDNCTKACAKDKAFARKRFQWVYADKCGANHLIPNGEYIICAVETTDEERCPEGHRCTDGEVCCPSKEHVCSLKYDSGIFAEGIEDKPRFAWNPKVQSCDRFSYYGASGNYNNFPTFNQCVSFCAKLADETTK